MQEDLTNTIANNTLNPPTPADIATTLPTTEVDTPTQVASEVEPEKDTPANLRAEDLLTETVQGIQHLVSEMQTLKRDFETKVKYDESKERMIDTLHSELQNYREGLHFKILRPFFMDLISLYDDMNSILEDMARDFPDLDTNIIANVQSFSNSVEDLLRNNEVEPFQMEEDIFVANQQRALRAIPTGDAAQDKHIARRLRKGFRYDNRILRPEIVETYRYIDNQ